MKTKYNNKTPKDIKKIIESLGEFEQAYYGNTLDKMIEYERVKARQELRNKVLKFFGYKYQYIETDVIEITKLNED